MENQKRLDSVIEIQKALCGMTFREERIITLEFERDVKPLLEGDVTFNAVVFSGESLEDVAGQCRKFLKAYGLRPKTDIVYRLQWRPDIGMTIRDLSFLDDLVFYREEVMSMKWGGDINENQKENVRLSVLISAPLPVMMYLHGFMSGANGAKQRQLQERFKGRYRVIAPELDADPDHSLEIINREIEREQPEIIIGTSLGGFMALECNSGNADVVIVNPCLYPRRQLSQWVGEEHTYFCKRLDGVQTYTLTQETLDKYERYDAVGSVKDKTGYVSALCSTVDDLLGDSHVKALDGLIAGDYNMVVDDFGHQCKDAGMGHLYELLERVISRRERVGDTPRSLRALERCHLQYINFEEKEKQTVMRMARTLETQKRERISVFGALARHLVYQRFLHLKDRLVDSIDEILADPAKASAVMPLPDDKVRLGAYLIWLRDTGHMPERNDEEEWSDFMRINDAITVCDNPMRLQDILSMYDTDANEQQDIIRH